MKILHLPAVIKEKKIGRNIIIQHLAERLDIKSESIEVSDSHLIVNIENGRLGIIQKGKNDTTGATKVISTNTKPALNNIYDSKFSWRKYPGLNDDYNPDEVTESWKGAFSFREEDLEQECVFSPTGHNSNHLLENLRFLQMAIQHPNPHN